MTFSTVSSYQGSSSDSFLSSVTDRLLNNNVIIMQISRNTSIACALLFLHVLICHMVFEGDAVIVVLSKGLIRKPQAANGNKQTTSVIVNSKIRRDSKGVRSKTKQKWIKSWISRVLRSKVLSWFVRPLHICPHNPYANQCSCMHSRMCYINMSLQ